MTQEELAAAVIFIPVSDIETYADWDERVGFGQMDQIFFDNGIAVKKEVEEQFRKHVKVFEAYLKE